MAEYKSRNSGLLQVTDVKDGDKIILMEPAYEQFSEAKQKSYWNCKVKLPNGTEKLAGLMDSACDAFASKWGGNTDGWAGHTAIVNIKKSKAGNDYISLIPSDDKAIAVTYDKKEPDTNDPSQFPASADDVNPADIPF